MNVSPTNTKGWEIKERKNLLISFAEDKGIDPNRLPMQGLNSLGSFYEAPASAHHHAAYPGGLFDHSMNVAEALFELTKANCLQWERAESPLLIGILHDLCKYDNYVQESFTDGLSDEPQYYYNTQPVLIGHGAKSVMIASIITQLTEEEMLCIRYHMGAYQTDEWKQFDLAIRRYPNVLWTHTADMIASKLMEETV